jgi:hypothetical protein
MKKGRIEEDASTQRSWLHCATSQIPRLIRVC